MLNVYGPWQTFSEIYAPLSPVKLSHILICYICSNINLVLSLLLTCMLRMFIDTYTVRPLSIGVIRSLQGKHSLLVVLFSCVVDPFSNK